MTLCDERQTDSEGHKNDRAVDQMKVSFFVEETKYQVEMQATREGGLSQLLNS